MGPANDYWPADLGGTTRARLVYTLIYIYVYLCAYMRDSRLAVSLYRPHEPLILGLFSVFARYFRGARFIFKGKNPRLIRKRSETSCSEI